PHAPRDADISKNIEGAQNKVIEFMRKYGSLHPELGVHDAAEWFRNQEKNRGAWDYKQQGPQYQEFGNFNFGAAGLATNLFGETILLEEAARAQVTAGTSRPEWGYPSSLPTSSWQTTIWDDPADQVQIKNG